MSAMLPPYACGSTQSKLMDYLEPSHYGVQLTDAEKRIVACWIDLAVPFAAPTSRRTRGIGKSLEPRVASRDEHMESTAAGTVRVLPDENACVFGQSELDNISSG